MGKYDGKAVLITGGSSGLGLATAGLLVAEGARVMITGRNQAALDSAAGQLGGSVIAVRSDAASLPDIDALVGRVKAEFGSLDLVFVNAGLTRFVPFESMTEEVYDEVFAANAKGAYFTVQKLAPVMREGGSVVF